jgi:hypothetical protein
MEATYRGILPHNFLVNEKYYVMLFIKKGSNAETYRVKGKTANSISSNCSIMQNFTVLLLTGKTTY